MIHPVEDKLCLGRLKGRLVKLAHTNGVDAQFVHLAEVGLPLFRLPLLRIIGRTDDVMLPEIGD